MAKKSREREHAKPRRLATMEAPKYPWDAADPEVTRAEPLDEDATAPLVLPAKKAAPAAPLELPQIEEMTALLELPPRAPPAGGVWEEGGENRTLYSAKAVVLASLLKDKFHHRMFGRAPYRVLRIDEPEGPSTAGGLLARQTLSLVAQGNAAPSAPCGWVDTAKGEAQLRSYELITARYEARHGVPLNLTREQYDSFLDSLVEALMAGSIKVRVYVPEPAATQVPASTRMPPLQRAGMVVLLLLFFALGLVVGRLVP